MGYGRLAIGDGLLDIGLSFCFAPQMRHGCISLEQKQNITTFYIYFCSLQRRRIFVKEIDKN